MGTKTPQICQCDEWCRDISDYPCYNRAIKKEGHYDIWRKTEKTENGKQDETRRMANLVWYISSEVRGKGYTTEAAKAVVKHLQNIGFERIEAFANIENVASQRVMEKIGMEYEGTLKKYDLRRNGSLYDAKMYAITERELD